MKYVIFKRGRGDILIYEPHIFPEHGTHACLKVEGCRPHSAGFFYIDDCGDVVIDQKRRSESLKLGPKAGDARLLQSTLGGDGSHAFLSVEARKAEIPLDENGEPLPSFEETMGRIKDVISRLRELAKPPKKGPKMALKPAKTAPDTLPSHKNAVASPTRAKKGRRIRL